MVLWVCIILIGLWMALRYLPAGWDSYRPLPELIALIPLLPIPLLILGIWSIQSKSVPQFFAICALLIIHALCLAAFYIPMPAFMHNILGLPVQNTVKISTGSTTTSDSPASDAVAATQPTITVMTLNTRYGKADAGSIMHAIKHYNVDVLALQEVSDDLVNRLHESSITSVLPYEQLGNKTNHDNGGYNALWSRHPFTDSAGQLLDGMGSHTPHIGIDVEGRPLRIVTTHPYSPQRGDIQWGYDIAKLGSLISDRNFATDKPTIVMGDLNSSVYHPSFRKVLQAGFTDSSFELRQGPHHTFPSSWGIIIPLIEIDHIIHTRELHATALETVIIARTDHAGLVATLTWN